MDNDFVKRVDDVEDTDVEQTGMPRLAIVGIVIGVIVLVVIGVIGYRVFFVGGNGGNDNVVGTSVITEQTESQSGFARVDSSEKDSVTQVSDDDSSDYSIPEEEVVTAGVFELRSAMIQKWDTTETGYVLRILVNAKNVSHEQVDFKEMPDISVNGVVATILDEGSVRGGAVFSATYECEVANTDTVIVEMLDKRREADVAHLSEGIVATETFPITESLAARSIAEHIVATIVELNESTDTIVDGQVETDDLSAQHKSSEDPYFKYVDPDKELIDSWKNKMGVDYTDVKESRDASGNLVITGNVVNLIDKETPGIVTVSCIMYDDDGNEVECSGEIISRHLEANETVAFTFTSTDKKATIYELSWLGYGNNALVDYVNVYGREVAEQLT